MKQWLVMISLVLCADYVTSQAGVTLNKCPSGSKVSDDYYILSGTEANCTCSKTSGSLIGQVTWYFDSNNTAIVSGNDDVVLTIQPGDKSRDKYRCELDHPGQGYGVTFEPKVAYGPTSVVLTTQNTTNGIFSQCPNGPNLTIECSVQSEVSPAPHLRVRLKYPGKNETILWSNHIGFQFEVTFPALSAETKRVVVYCEAVNIQFTRDLNVTNSSTVTINEPPSSYPVTSIRNARNKQKFSGNDTAIVILNDALDVSCEVTGGSPDVDNVTLDCGPNKKLTKTGTSAQLQFDASGRTTSQSCSCQASHVTGCYSLVTNITIDSVYQPEIDTFTANGEIKLTINRGDQVQFFCKVDADPQPKLSIVRDRNPSPIFTTQDLQLNGRIANIQCDDTDRYYCVADNGIQSSVDQAQMALDIYVLCTPSLRDSSIEGKTYEVSIGKNLTIQLEIVGYPAPSSFALVVKRATHQTNVDSRRYRVTTPSPSEPTPWLLTTLVLYKVQSSDLVTYSLTLSNGQGSGLSYTFTVAEDKEDSIILYIGIGLGVGVFLIILIVIVIIVVVVIFRRSNQTQGLSANNSNNTATRRPQTDQVRVCHPTALPSRQENHSCNPVHHNGRRPSLATSTNSSHIYLTPTDDTYLTPTDAELYDDISGNTQSDHYYLTLLSDDTHNPRPHNNYGPLSQATRGGYMGPQVFEGPRKGY